MDANEYGGLTDPKVVGKMSGKTQLDLAIAVQDKIHEWLRAGGVQKDSPGGAKYRAFVKEMIGLVGMGFHPDTSVDKYVEMASGRPSFTKAEVKRLEALESKAYALGGFDQYEIAMQELRPLIAAAKRRQVLGEFRQA